jgi:hypothetical protein
MPQRSLAELKQIGLLKAVAVPLRRPRFAVSVVQVAPPSRAIVAALLPKTLGRNASCPLSLSFPSHMRRRRSSIELKMKKRKEKKDRALFSTT